MSNNSCIVTTCDDASIARAVAYLRAGDAVVFPTETVYGLGADACSDAAVQSIYRIKGRPAANPLIVHVADADVAERFASLTPLARHVLDAFAPGAISVVVPLREGSGLSAHLLGGGRTVALRIPVHPVARALLEAFGGGIAAPSANRSGRISPTTAQHVVHEFGGREDIPAMILDAGATTVGLESTVVDCTGEVARILRQGSITAAMLKEVVPLAELEGTVGQGVLTSPGMLASHYAPRARVRLGAREVRQGEALLAFGAHVPPHENVTCLNLSPSGDLEEAAHHLYGYLRQLDDAGVTCIAVMPVPMEGIGTAINDRLARAAAAR